MSTRNRRKSDPYGGYQYDYDYRIPRDDPYPTSAATYDTKPPPSTYDDRVPPISTAPGGAGRGYNSTGYEYVGTEEPPSYPPTPEGTPKRSKSHKTHKYQPATDSVSAAAPASATTAKPSTRHHHPRPAFTQRLSAVPRQFKPNLDRAPPRVKAFGKEAFNTIGDAFEAYAAAQGYSQAAQAATPAPAPASAEAAPPSSAKLRGRSEGRPSARHDELYDEYHLPRKYSRPRRHDRDHDRGRDRGRDRGVDTDYANRRYPTPSPSPPRRRGTHQYDDRRGRRPEASRRQSYSLSPSTMSRRRDTSPGYGYAAPAAAAGVAGAAAGAGLNAARGRRGRPDYSRQQSYSASPNPRRRTGILDHSPTDYDRGRTRRHSERRRRTYSPSPSPSPSPDRYGDRRRSGRHAPSGASKSAGYSQSRTDVSGGGGRGRGSEPKAAAYGRSRSSNPTAAQRRWQIAAKAAIEAGGVTAFRLRSQPGNWVGDKGAKVATAALGAAAMDAFMKDDPRQKKAGGMRGMTEDAIGSFLAGQIVSGGLKGRSKSRR